MKVIGDVGNAWCLGHSQSLQDTQHPSHPLKGVAPHHVTARCRCNDFGGDCVGTGEYLSVGERMRSSAIYWESRKGPALLDAGAGCPWFCGSAEAEGRGIGRLLQWERSDEPPGWEHGPDLPTGPPRPSAADGGSF